MVSGIVIGIIGIGLTIFLASGGAQLTREAFAEGKKLTTQLRESLGKLTTDNVSQGNDRDVENQ